MIEEQIKTALWFRHACKQFNDKKKIPKQLFQLILETARLSPSSFGITPWKFIVLQDRRLREKMLPFVWGGQKQIPTCSHLVITLARKPWFMRYDSEYVKYYMAHIQQSDEETIQFRSNLYQKFQESDFKLLENTRTMFDWSCKQTYIALGNMMTTAALLEIDSCPIEGFEQDAMTTFVEKELDVSPAQFGVSHLVAFGYRIDPPRPKTRQSIEEIVDWVI